MAAIQNYVADLASSHRHARRVAVQAADVTGLTAVARSAELV
jgi:hypothetical protein